MPDYKKEIEIKDVGILSIKLKTKQSEYFIVEDENFEELDKKELQEIKDYSQSIREKSLAKLKATYGETIPQEELDNLDITIFNIDAYMEGTLSSGLNNAFFRDIESKMSNYRNIKIGILKNLVNKALDEASIDNWDNEGALPISRDITKYTDTVVEWIVDNGLSNPKIEPDPLVIIDFEWYPFAGGHFAISVKENGNILYSANDVESGFNIYGNVDSLEKIPEKFLKALKKKIDCRDEELMSKLFRQLTYSYIMERNKRIELESELDKKVNRIGEEKFPEAKDDKTEPIMAEA